MPARDCRVAKTAQHRVAGYEGRLAILARCCDRSIFVSVYWRMPGAGAGASVNGAGEFGAARGPGGQGATPSVRARPPAERALILGRPSVRLATDFPFDEGRGSPIEILES